MLGKDATVGDHHVKARCISYVQWKQQMEAPSKLPSKRSDRESLEQKIQLYGLRKRVEAAGLVLGAGWHVKCKVRETGQRAGNLTRPHSFLYLHQI